VTHGASALTDDIKELLKTPALRLAESHSSCRAEACRDQTG
jgi:hypothetical protein